MKVRELMKFLQKVDPNADVLLKAFHSAALEQNHLSITDGSLTISLHDFVDKEDEYSNMLCSFVSTVGKNR